MVRQTFRRTVVLGAAGSGTVQLVARGDLRVNHTRVRVTGPAGAASTLQSTATVELSGDDFEGSYSGNNDASDTVHLMIAGDILTCTWTGGDVGATATLTVRAIEYPAGQGMKAVYGAVQ